MKDHFNALGIVLGLLFLCLFCVSLRLGLNAIKQSFHSPTSPSTLPQTKPSRFDSTHILITGVTGFLGSHIARKLSQHYYQVVGLDSLSDGSEETRFKFLRLDDLLTNITVLDADICNSTLLASLHSQYSFQYVFLLSDNAHCSCLAPLLTTPDHYSHPSKIYVFYLATHVNMFQSCFHRHQKLRGVSMHVDHRLMGPYLWPYVYAETQTGSQYQGPGVIFNNLTGTWTINTYLCAVLNATLIIFSIINS
ncbi:NAD-dependent epimerase/dehydratase family protein [archaeon]|nr:MAG: NAD-dependent epimerase/dehydratase family protein [archaeon]